MKILRINKVFTYNEIYAPQLLTINNMILLKKINQFVLQKNLNFCNKIGLIKFITSNNKFNSHDLLFKKKKLLQKSRSKKNTSKDNLKTNSNSFYDNVQKHSKANLIFSESNLLCVTSISVSDRIDLKLLFPELKFLSYRVVIEDEVINVTFNNKNLMILSNGNIVGWDIDQDIIVNKFLPLVKNKIDIFFYKNFETEQIDYIERNISSQDRHENRSYICDEVIVINGVCPNQRLLDKAVIALGISRSMKLSIIEDSFESCISATKNNPLLLSKGEKVTTSESEFLKLTGKLFVLRGNLNLYSELIDTPEFYWSEPELEKIYNAVSNVLDIKPRTSILNRKLDYSIEEQKSFLSVLNEKKSTRLEYIIIVLIMTEVMFEIFNFINNHMYNKK